MNLNSILFIDFFPFGESNGDRVGPRAVDKSVGVNLNVPLVFFQKKELNIIFVRL